MMNVISITQMRSNQSVGSILNARISNKPASPSHLVLEVARESGE